jgi:diguanylate cyclase (GGDEF)-like protein
MKHNVDTNIDYFDRHLDRIRRNVALACVFLIILATIPVAIARATNGWDLTSYIQFISTFLLLAVFAYVYLNGYRKIIGVIIYSIDMVLMSVVTLDSLGNELIVLFFITPLLVAYLFFPFRKALIVSLFSYTYLSVLYFIEHVDIGSPSYHFDTVLLIFAGISSIAGLHVVVGLRHSIERQLISAAHTDALTGLPNRMYFDVRLEQEFSRADREQTPLCLALVDLDRFKVVNDTYGHECGDQVLSHLAKLIDESIRAADIVCRVGGEELVILLPNTAIEEAQEILERLRLSIANASIPWKSHRIALTASTGLAEYTASQDKEGLYAQADKALYLAKKQGRNKVVCANAV